jgi:hypothetical protein
VENDKPSTLHQEVALSVPKYPQSQTDFKLGTSGTQEARINLSNDQNNKKWNKISNQKFLSIFSKKRTTLVAQ